MNLADTYNDVIGQLNPEPLPVQISFDTCRKHNFNLVSVPRDSGTGEQQTFKCPLRSCSGK